MAGVDIPVRGAPLQMVVTEPTAPTLGRLVAHASRHLTLKQMASGAFMVGGGWTAGLDERHKLSRALRSSVEGNLWVASRVVPALADLHAIRIWAGMNVNIWDVNDAIQVLVNDGRPVDPARLADSVVPLEEAAG